MQHIVIQQVIEAENHERGSSFDIHKKQSTREIEYSYLTATLHKSCFLDMFQPGPNQSIILTLVGQL